MIGNDRPRAPGAWRRPHGLAARRIGAAARRVSPRALQRPRHGVIVPSAMTSLPRTVARVGLCSYGVLLLLSGLAALFAPEHLASQAAGRPGRVVELVCGFGALGYAALLVLSPRWLLQRIWLLGVLLAFVAAFGVGFVLIAGDQPDLVRLAVGLALRLAPAGLALALVALEARIRR
jgi:hypothetical protein